jgi:putative nucleotidyltransferase with HDIG domain
MRICLDKIISAISIALDLAEISSSKSFDIIESKINLDYSKHKFLYHSRRTSYIAVELGKVLNLDNSIQKRLYVASMLHDIGAANSLISSHNADEFIVDHTKLGASILKSSPFFRDISHIVLYHHENFDGSGAFKLKGSSIPLESQILRLADLLEIQYDDTLPGYVQKQNLTCWITNNKKVIFSDEVVEAYMRASSADTFWFNLENIIHMDFIISRVAPNLDTYLNLKDFESVAFIFSDIIDNSSKFTARHSREIAELAFRVAKHLQYPEEKCIKMKIAGLLHDIGKLSIPSRILDKEGSLTPEEFSIIKSHPYYTKIILDKIESIPDISDWASNHHEKLNGKGYPRSLKAEEISEESRILGVCDIYIALTEDRPYRKELSMDKAFAILDKMTEEGFVCHRAVNQLKSTLNFR